ncbi:hypothetical protein [Curtobacterium sp. ISL-83]|uniref:hypothetical protein n=1 Tax=Curtobacterium sp. ISL-83 TaxID=2819145 RepID=UPI001BE5305B|nr:hypothetical protein [Curtobacterium sp. ISL-83]MBT2504193.1 hypothetical protein [Curtobacterium sp. ISL-83]
MHRQISLAPIPALPVLRTSAHRPDESDVIRQRARSGELARIARGCFVDAAGWDALRPAEQHLVRLQAAADRIRPDQVVSHVSAAVVLGVPMVSSLPGRIHLTSVGGDRRTTNATFIVHADLDPGFEASSITTPAGLRLSGPERIAADTALTLPFVDAVVAMDDLLRRGVTRERVREMLERRGPKGRRRALRAVDFADPSADSPGESVARTRFDEFGTEPPVLQHRFREPGRPDIVVDFWFPAAGVVVEFDGEVKYRDATMRGGLPVEDVVIAEKYREDRLRAMPGVRHVVRLRWADLWDGAALRAKLRRAGVRMTR